MKLKLNTKILMRCPITDEPMRHTANPILHKKGSGACRIKLIRLYVGC